jgi:hypothetical protein
VGLFVPSVRQLETVVEVLPTAPQEGQVVTLQTPAMAALGIRWRMRYNASSASIYKWEYTGGAHWGASASAARSVTNTGTYQAVATDPMSITVPCAGDYFVEIGGRTLNGVALVTWLNYSIAGVAPADDNRAVVSQQGSAVTAEVIGSTKSIATVVAANTALSEISKVSGGTGTVQLRFMNLIPIRLA